MAKKSLLTLAAAATCAFAAPAFAQGSSFAEVWSAAQTSPYFSLPEHKTVLSTLFDGNTNLLQSSAERTLWDESDTLPRFQKLVHPIGICFAGTWTITEASQYTGYFAKDAKGLIIVRASEAMGNGTTADWRAFGFAGKIFPTADANDQTKYKTANFFTVDDLGGTDAKHFLDTAKSNAPKTSFHASQLAIFPTLVEIARVFAKADTDPGVRQVYPIAELGLNDPSRAVTPKWFSVRSETANRVDAADFRDELRLANYPDGLKFGIYVSDDSSAWTRIGQIALTQEALADGCDHVVHFHHPATK